MGRDLGDFVGNPFAGIRNIGRIDEIGEEKDNESEADDFLGAEFDFVEKCNQYRVEDIDHGEPAEPKGENAREADTPVEIEKLVGIIPPFEVFESFEIPAGEIFQETTSNGGCKKDDDGVLFEASE